VVAGPTGHHDWSQSKPTCVIIIAFNDRCKFYAGDPTRDYFNPS